MKKGIIVLLDCFPLKSTDLEILKTKFYHPFMSSNNELLFFLVSS